MRTFNYKIYKGSSVVLMNTIHRQTKEEALSDLEKLKEEYEGTEVKIAEVSSANNWSC